MLAHEIIARTDGATWRMHAGAGQQQAGEQQVR
jgi:hypothetical protein